MLDPNGLDLEFFRFGLKHTPVELSRFGMTPEIGTGVSDSRLRHHYQTPRIGDVPTFNPRYRPQHEVKFLNRLILQVEPSQQVPLSQQDLWNRRVSGIALDVFSQQLQSPFQMPARLILFSRQLALMGQLQKSEFPGVLLDTFRGIRIEYRFDRSTKLL